MRITKQTILSRRSFFRWLAGLGAGIFFWLWHLLTQKQMQKESPFAYRHGQDIPFGVSHHGSYYLFRSADSVRAFSTVCTHAGCRIKTNGSTTLRCACHGSQFDAESGRVLNGPALRSLAELSCSFDQATGQWIITIPAIERK